MADKLTLPPQDVPLVDVRTGKINEHWYIFIKRMLDKLNGLI